MIDLKPCPFGGKSHYVIVDTKKWDDGGWLASAVCRDCMIRLTATGTSEEQALEKLKEKWDSRPCDDLPSVQPYPCPKCYNGNVVVGVLDGEDGKHGDVTCNCGISFLDKDARDSDIEAMESAILKWNRRCM